MKFRYERLQDFCYRCGCIDHINTECTFDVISGGVAGYGEWTKAPPIRDELVISRPLAVEVGEQRQADTVRGCALPTIQNQGSGPSSSLQRDVHQVSGVVCNTQHCHEKRWRGKTRGHESNTLLLGEGLADGNQVGRDQSIISHGVAAQSGSQPGLAGLEYRTIREIQRKWVNPDSVLAGGSGMKREGVFQRWEIL